MAEITFYTPSTEAELLPIFQDLRFLLSFTPYQMSEEEAYKALCSTLGDTTLVFVDGRPVGCFTLLMYRKSAELHGVFRPDMGSAVFQHKRLKSEIVNIIFHTVFSVYGKEKIVIKALPDNNGVRGFAILYGFKKLKMPDGRPTVEKGHHIWKLTKEDYLARMNKLCQWAEASALLT